MTSATFGQETPTSSSTSFLQIADDLPFVELDEGAIVIMPIGYGLAPIDGADAAYGAYRRFREIVYVEDGGILDLRKDEVTTDFDDDDLARFTLRQSSESATTTASLDLCGSSFEPPRADSTNCESVGWRRR